MGWMVVLYMGQAWGLRVESYAERPSKKPPPAVQGVFKRPSSTAASQRWVKLESLSAHFCDVVENRWGSSHTTKIPHRRVVRLVLDGVPFGTRRGGSESAVRALKQETRPPPS